MLPTLRIIFYWKSQQVGKLLVIDKSDPITVHIGMINDEMIKPGQTIAQWFFI